MIRFPTTISIVLLLAGGSLLQADDKKFSVELEVGAVWQSRNDVQIPNDPMGTRFSLVDLVGRGPYPAARFYFVWNIRGRHGLRFLAAPLSYTDSGTFDSQVDFAGSSFAAGVPTEASYGFNSWRLSYRYRFLDSTRWRAWIGFTAKLRDAQIELRQPGTEARDDNLGFVPLLHVSADYRFAERWHLLLDLDALAGGPGRAEDFAIKLGYDVSDRWGFTFGYRTVEGGADVDDVFNFAWFNYAVASGVFRF